MASIGREGERGELKRIIYRDAAGKQRSLRLGKCSERAALNALAGFERVLEAHRVGSTIHPEGVRWLEAIDDRLHARVVRLGLGVEPRNRAPMVTLANLLERSVPAHVVAGWLGHSPLIAARHYLHTRDAHFDMATGVGQAARNPATQVRPSDTTDKHAKAQSLEIPAVMVGCGSGCDPVKSGKVGATGFEPVTSAM